MTDESNNIPKATLEALARNLFKEADAYGFKQVDYVRFVNYILDCAMQKQGSSSVPLPNQKTSDQNLIHQNTTKKPIQLPLTGQRVTIRKSTEEDREMISQWLDDTLGRYFLLSRTTAKRTSLDTLISSEYHIIGIVTLPDGTSIGVMAFLNYDVMQFKAELRKLIGNPKMRGKGLGKEATRLWIRYGFESLDLKKIYVNTLETNLANIRLNEELGFRVEGILRNEVFVDGAYRDVLRMGLLR